MENCTYQRVTSDIMLLRRIGYPAVTNITSLEQLYDLGKLSCNKDVHSSVNSIWNSSWSRAKNVSRGNHIAKLDRKICIRWLNAMYFKSTVMLDGYVFALLDRNLQLAQRRIQSPG